MAHHVRVVALIQGHAPWHANLPKVKEALREAWLKSYEPCMLSTIATAPLQKDRHCVCGISAIGFPAQGVTPAAASSSAHAGISFDFLYQ